jgi:hypothetical protein
MNHLKRRPVIGLAMAPLIAIMLLAVPAVVWAEDELPKAETILDKYVEVTGGKAAYDKLQNSITKMTVEFVGQNLTLDVTVYQSRPNNQYVVVDSDALGKIEQGVTGDVAWGKSLMSGPVIKEGNEKAAALREAAFDSSENWRKYAKKVECVGVEDVDGKPCYKVVVTYEEGEPETRYYDKESNLYVKSASTIEVAEGKFPVEVYPSEYKKVNGVLTPHRIRMSIAGIQERIMQVKSIEYNVDIPKEKFQLPDDVKALLDKKAEDKKTEDKKTEGE